MKRGRRGFRGSIAPSRQRAIAARRQRVSSDLKASGNFLRPKFIGAKQQPPCPISDYSAGIEILKIVKKVEKF